LRKRGTERPFTNEYWDEHADGIYVCAACGLELYDANTKFNSGTGWPSFFQAVNNKHVETTTDHDIGVARTEVHCARCGGHLGHIFNDGPAPTGQRHCINSVSLKLVKKPGDASAAAPAEGAQPKASGQSGAPTSRPTSQPSSRPSK
jgi:peptide-methionine (R)-S-oxide reductase